MPWPPDDLSTDGVDAGADTPPRAEFFKLFQRVKAMIAGRGTAEGVASLDARRRVPDAELGRAVAGGVASLDGSGRVPAAQLPPQPEPPRAWKPGDVKLHAGPDVEAGWLLADGGEASRIDDAALFAAIGTRWGEGDGVTTFGLPDFMDTFLLGASETRPVGTTGGAETHTLTLDEVPEHDHALAGSVGGSGAGAGTTLVASGGSLVASDTYDQGGGQPHNNMPPFAALLVLIKR